MNKLTYVLLIAGGLKTQLATVKRELASSNFYNQERSENTRNTSKHSTLVFSPLWLDALKMQTSVLKHTPIWRHVKPLVVHISILTIYIWARPRCSLAAGHTELPTWSSFLCALWVLVMRCVSPRFVCCPSLLGQLQHSGVIASPQLFQLVLEADCPLNGQFVVVNLHHLWLFLPSVQVCLCAHTVVAAVSIW